MQIGELFERDVTRAIPPVVYFHEQDPVELKREVDEYIITGGYGPKDPRRTPDGIHEQFVRLLTAMRAELDKPGGPELPASWISGYYGSGKSSFAKLVGLALDGKKLPDGRVLADALLSQDVSPGAADLKAAWHKLVTGIRPIAVVFDVGSRARDDEHVHAVVVRQVQQRLGYSGSSQAVADYELRLEREGLFDTFMDHVHKVHGRPWRELKDSQLAEDYFSAVMFAMKPDLFTHTLAWVDSRSGSELGTRRSADEAALAIADMIKLRADGTTLFIVVDEVSQYVHDDHERMLALQSFVSALGQRLKGRAWLLATGQQKLEEAAASGGGSAVVKLKDRFPTSLRVHLGFANIRDVVHKRLLRKKKLAETEIGEHFDEHRPDLALHAYKGELIERSDFIEVYPLLPGHFELILEITSGLRDRSSRTQGDAYAIRGLLQLLGDLFRDKQLGRMEMGRLVTLDLIYDVLGSAIGTDIQQTIHLALEFAKTQNNPLLERVLKAVALLEVVQRREKTTPELVARALYEKLGQGNVQPAVEQALDTLRGQGFLGFSDQHGYKIESSAGQEWQREREAYSPSAEQRSARIVTALGHLIDDTDKAKLEKTPLPWLALFSDGVSSKEARIRDDRKPTVVAVDLHATKGEDRGAWIARSDTGANRDRIIWVTENLDDMRHAALSLERSARMVSGYEGRATTLPEDKQRLLIEERNRRDAAESELRRAVDAALMGGQLFFRGRTQDPRAYGQSFTDALHRFAQSVMGELYPHPTTFTVTEKDIVFLIDNKDLAAPPQVLGQDQLGLIALEANRHELTCNGRVPTDVLAFIQEQGAVQGATLVGHFGAPPHGVLPDVLRATVVALLRARRIRVELPGVGELTSIWDEGARELLKDSGLRRASLSLNTVETLGPKDRNAICALFKDYLHKDVARDNDAIADAVAERFGAVREQLTALESRFRRMPQTVKYPEALDKLAKALEAARRDRKVEPTVLAVKKHLTALRDGFALLRRMQTDLTDEALELLDLAARTERDELPALRTLGAGSDVLAAADRVHGHLVTERPWEDLGELRRDVDIVRAAYRAERRTRLDAHAGLIDQVVDAMKRRPDLQKLDPDQRHEVLRHLRDAAARPEHELTPPLEALESFLASRRATGEAKARAALDALLESLGSSPVVEVDVALRGREIESEADLDRLLADLRARILHELAAKHRVRLK